MSHPKDGVGQVTVALKQPSLLWIGVKVGSSHTCTAHDVSEDPLALWGRKDLLVVML